MSRMIVGQKAQPQRRRLEARDRMWEDITRLEIFVVAKHGVDDSAQHGVVERDVADIRSMVTDNGWRAAGCVAMGRLRRGAEIAPIKSTVYPPSIHPNSTFPRKS